MPPKDELIKIIQYLDTLEVKTAHSIEIMELKVKGLAIPQALEEAARKPAPAKKSAAREPVGKKGA